MAIFVKRQMFNCGLASQADTTAAECIVETHRYRGVWSYINGYCPIDFLDPPSEYPHTVKTALHQTDGLSPSGTF